MYGVGEVVRQVQLAGLDTLRPGAIIETAESPGYAQVSMQAHALL